jgi:hypothetical protein
MPRFGPLLVAAFGCSEGRSIEGSLESLEADTPSRVEVGSAIGRDRVAIPIRVVNEIGVPVRGSTVELEVSGECADGTAIVLEESSVAVDASGHGLAHALAPCSAVFSVRATASGDDATIGETAQSYAFDNVAPTFRLGTAASLPPEARHPSFVGAGTGGVALGVGAEIWWQSGAPGRPPFRVATLPSPLAGLREAHVDADGVLDLVAWGGSVVVVLRGVDGDYTWQDGFRIADDWTIVGVAAQDLDGDRLVDLAIASTGDGAGSVEILTGNGAGEWRTTDVLDTSFAVSGVAAADDDRDGRAELTVLDGERGWLQRWTQSETVWVEGAPAELIDPTEDDDLPYEAPEGSVLLPMADLDGDGRRDLAVSEAPQSGFQRLVFFVLGTERVTFFHESYDAHVANVADMNQDGAADLLALEDDVLHIIRNDLATDRFTSQGVLGVGTAAPFVATDLDADAIPDLAIVHEDALFFRGDLVTDDDATVWTAVESGATSFQVGLTGPHAIADTTGDDLADVVGFTTSTAGATVLRNWTVTQEGGAVAMSTIGSTAAFDLGGDVIPYDLAHCGDSYYALAGVGGAAELVRVVANSGLVRTATQSVAGTLLACGPLGAATVVVAGEDGAWTSYDESLAAVDSGTIDPSGAIAVADPDGDGAHAIVGCAPAPCDVAVADIDADGLDEIVRSSESALSIEGWGTTRELPGAGTLSVADVDRDGFVDVLASDPLAGRVLVFRGLKGGVAPALAYHPDGALVGASDAFDTTGDGVPEILFEGQGGNLTITAPSTLAND